MDYNKSEKLILEKSRMSVSVLIKVIYYDNLSCFRKFNWTEIVVFS